MKIKKIKYKGYSNCYELTIKNQKMIVATDFGPRIIFFGEKENILFYDEEKKLKNDKGWILYGGHRLWIAPESTWTYNPDNDICEASVEKKSIIIKGYDPKLKFDKILTIYENNNRFNVKHTFVNKSGALFPGAIWALTCVVPKGTVFIPWGTKGDFKMNKVVYWLDWLGQKSDLKSNQYIKTKDLFLIEPTGEVGKIGVAGHEGFIGIANNNYTFIKKFNRLQTNDYPDDNCAIECYTCIDFIELETLSPNTVFLPDVPFSHTEEWILINKKIDPYDGNNIRKLLEK